MTKPFFVDPLLRRITSCQRIVRQNNPKFLNSPPEEGCHAKRDGVVEIFLNFLSWQSFHPANSDSDKKISTTPSATPPPLLWRRIFRSKLLPLLCVFLTLIFSCFFITANTTIYKTVEAGGVISFSDFPSKGSTEVPLSSLAHLNSFTLPTVTVSSPPSATLSPLAQNPTTTDNTYTVTLVSPKANTIFLLSDKSFLFKATLQPLLTSEDLAHKQVVLSIYDAINPSTPTTMTGSLQAEGSVEFSPPNLSVGQSILIVTVIDTKSGAVLGKSAPVTIFFKQTPTGATLHAGSFAGA